MLGPKFESFDCISAMMLIVIDQCNGCYGLSMRRTSSCANHNNVNVIILPLWKNLNWIISQIRNYYVINLLNLLVKGARQDIIVFIICDVKPQSFKILEQNIMAKERTLRKKFMYQEPWPKTGKSDWALPWLERKVFALHVEDSLTHIARRGLRGLRGGARRLTVTYFSLSRLLLIHWAMPIPHVSIPVPSSIIDNLGGR